MNKLAEIILEHASFQELDLSISLVREILENFTEWPKEVREEFKETLVDLREYKKQRDQEDAKIQKEIEYRNKRIEYERHTNPFYDPRNESNFSPNG